MIFADWILLAGIAIFAGLGVFLGFGKTLEFITKGIPGIIISVVICYFCFGLVYNIPFVQLLLLKFKQALAATESPFVHFFFTIRIDIIVYVICLFLVVFGVRFALVLLLKNVMEIKTKPMKIANMTLGGILGAAIFVSLGLIILQIAFFAKDGASSTVLEGSLFRLNLLYEHNPLAAQIIKWLRPVVESAA